MSETRCVCKLGPWLLPDLPWGPVERDVLGSLCTDKMCPCMQKGDEEMADGSTVRVGVQTGVGPDRGSQEVMSVP